MKKLLIICGLLFSVTTFAQAQQGQGGGRQMGTPEERAKRSTDMLAEKLTLTADQKKLFTAWKDERKEMMKKRQEGGGQRPGGTK